MNFRAAVAASLSDPTAVFRLRQRLGQLLPDWLDPTVDLGQHAAQIAMRR